MNKPITLSELQRSIKSSLAQSFPLPIWVSAEISELKVNYSGHCYIELVERSEGQRAATAQARAVIWRSSYTALASYFEAQTGQRLAAGIKILAKVAVSYHELYGLSLQITDIDPTYTIGEEQRQRSLTIAQLQKDGVWDMNRGQLLPMLVQRLAIVSSANAAGYQDFMREIESSPYYFSTTLFDAFMQGAGAEESIVGALEAIANSDEEFDAVVLIRGGGSVSDLRCFDSYRLCSHVAQFPLPILAGIGHDKDVSVADMVAAYTLKTPTAVATMLTERMAQNEGWLEAMMQTMYDVAVNITHTQKLKLEGYLKDVRSHLARKIEIEKQRVENYKQQLPLIIRQRLELEKGRVEGYSRAVEIYNPQHLLQLGYSIISRGEKLISKGSQVSLGDEISIRLSDALLVAQIVKNEKIEIE